MHTWRRRKDSLGVFGEYAKRHKNMYISVNNNTNFKKKYILSIYTIWDRFSLKTISRYCPFKKRRKKIAILIKRRDVAVSSLKGGVICFQMTCQ
jgi:hypothetical protein